MSSATWRLADLFAKNAFLLNGLGWGGMPLHTVQRDIAEGRLVELSIEDVPQGGLNLPMSAVYPTSAPPGSAAAGSSRGSSSARVKWRACPKRTEPGSL